MPVYREGASISSRLAIVCAELAADAELLVVYDIEDDPTVAYVRDVAASDGRVRPVHNTVGRGPANAIRFGFAASRAQVVVVTMADGSDDASHVMALARLVQDGAAVAAASRYTAGGRQEGGPFLKRTLSRLAGWTLHVFARVPIHDVTSAFKAYSKSFIDSVSIESTGGFEITLELVAKAHRLRLPMAEIPTVWHDRTEGSSNFRLAKWLPSYLRWYLFAFGPRLSQAQLAGRTEAAVP
jgi:glycosyltransferase involved in cell wall biosynthesis